MWDHWPVKARNSVKLHCINLFILCRVPLSLAVKPPHSVFLPPNIDVLQGLDQGSPTPVELNN